MDAVDTSGGALTLPLPRRDWLDVRRSLMTQSRLSAITRMAGDANAGVVEDTTTRLVGLIDSLLDERS